MPIKLDIAERKEFILEESDKIIGNTTEPTKISVRQASQGEYTRRQDLFSSWKRQFDPEVGGDVVIQHFNYEIMKRLEVYLTLADCNIEDSDGSVLFRFRDGRISMQESEFNKAWGKLPLIIANEIHQKVLAVNPDWGPGGEVL